MEDPKEQLRKKWNEWYLNKNSWPTDKPYNTLDVIFDFFYSEIEKRDKQIEVWRDLNTETYLKHLEEVQGLRAQLKAADNYIYALIDYSEATITGDKLKAALEKYETLKKEKI